MIKGKYTNVSILICTYGHTIYIFSTDIKEEEEEEEEIIFLFLFSYDETAFNIYRLPNFYV